MHEIKLNGKKGFGKVALVDSENIKKLYLNSWSLHSGGYAISGGGVKPLLYMHRFIMGDICKNKIVDHINGNKLDNRKCNLRVCSFRENSFNTNKKRKNNSSGIMGVHYNKLLKKWIAQVRHCGKTIHLGCFENIKDAAEKRDLFIIKNRGEFAKPHFPKEIYKGVS